MNRFKALLFIALLTLSLGNWLNAAEQSTATSQEIEQLIQAVEQSACTFQRNGKSYTAAEGADHLRLKLKRGGKYADTTEHFITRLASKSSWSGKPYQIESPTGESSTMQAWLEAQLTRIRKAEQKPS
ncbi:MAG: hypothetical protein ACI8Z5_000878 [Lentimonas sp.]|jgi:hypothetical protein